jgi:DNA-binding response OmpR family regulator
MVARPNRSASGERLKTRMVLFAEASSAARAPYAELLAFEGLAVVEASDGREALEKARTFRPDLVVTDLYLPTLDGLGLIAALRDDATTRHIPVLGLIPRTTEIGPLRRAGFALLLRKPCMPRLLLERVRGLLERTRPGGAQCR